MTKYDYEVYYRNGSTRSLLCFSTGAQYLYAESAVGDAKSKLAGSRAFSVADLEVVAVPKFVGREVDTAAS